jgi:hypothetical protein
MADKIQPGMEIGDVFAILRESGPSTHIQMSEPFGHFDGLLCDFGPRLGTLNVIFDRHKVFLKDLDPGDRCLADKPTFLDEIEDFVNRIRDALSH